MLFILSVILSAFNVINPYLVKILIDDILIAKNYKLLVALMSFFIFVFIIRTVIGIFHAYQAVALEENIVLDVKKDLFQHLEQLDMQFYHKRKIGDILTRLADDVYSIESFLGILIDQILMNVLMGGFILAICLHLNWRVTLASLTFFPILILTQKYYGKRIKKSRKKVIEKSADLLSFMQEIIISIKMIQAFVLEKFNLDQYLKKSRNLIRKELKLTLLSSYAGAAAGFITFVPLIIILWYGGFNVMEGTLTVGSLIALYTYVGRLFGPVSSLGSVNVSIQSTLVSVDRVFEFMDKKPKVYNKKNAIPLRSVKGKIEFRNVNFQYDKDEPVLNNINLSISPGETIGLIGPSGSGKSTLANMIARFYDPVNGQILLDGKNLKDLKIESLRKAIGIVSQQNILFNTSIKENIKFGDENATDEDIIRAAKLANIHDFITTLKEGYDTIVGDRGVRLSGGQQQRISIARAILKNPKIVILDEATSSLDTESEQKIQLALENVTRGRTTVIIAHRLSTIKNVEQNYCFKRSYNCRNRWI